MNSLTNRRTTFLYLAMAVFGSLALQAAQVPLGNSSTPGSDFAVLENNFYFSAHQSSSQGRNLWRTDGTAAGTRQLTRFEDGVVERMVVLGNALYFMLVHEHEESSLYVTDGTEEGVRKLADFEGSVDAMQPCGDSICLVRRTADGLSLMRSDGTPAGTTSVVPLPGKQALEARAMGERIYLLLSGVESGNKVQLWQSDGSAAGTIQLTQSHQNIVLRNALMLGGDLLFDVDGALWKSDGRRSGTGPLLDAASVVGIVGQTAFLWTNGELRKTDRADGISTPVATMSQRPLTAVTDGSRLFFVTATMIGVTDGTNEGTTTLSRGYGFGNFPTIALMDGVLYFRFDESATGWRLWRSDLTYAGTRVVKDLTPESRSSSPSELTAIGGRIFFFAADRTHGREPWISDGTPAGTQMIANVFPEMTIRGSVVDAHSGAPIRSGLITVRSPGGESVFAADQNGAFTIEGLAEREYTIFAHSSRVGHLAQAWKDVDCMTCPRPGSTPVVGIPGTVQDGFDFKLKPGATIAGRSSTPAASRSRESKSSSHVRSAPSPSRGRCPAAPACTKPSARFRTMNRSSSTPPRRAVSRE